MKYPSFNFLNFTYSWDTCQDAEGLDRYIKNLVRAIFMLEIFFMGIVINVCGFTIINSILLSIGIFFAGISDVKWFCNNRKRIEVHFWS